MLETQFYTITKSRWANARLKPNTLKSKLNEIWRCLFRASPFVCLLCFVNVMAKQHHEQHPTVDRNAAFLPHIDQQPQKFPPKHASPACHWRHWLEDRRDGFLLIMISRSRIFLPFSSSDFLTPPPTSPITHHPSQP